MSQNYFANAGYCVPLISILPNLPEDVLDAVRTAAYESDESALQLFYESWWPIELTLPDQICYFCGEDTSLRGDDEVFDDVFVVFAAEDLYTLVPNASLQHLQAMGVTPTRQFWVTC